MDSLKKRGNRKQLVEALNELLDHLCDVESELNLHEVVMDGSWPGAVAQLQRALKKAKAIAKERAVNHG